MSNIPQETVWEIFGYISKLYDNLYVENDELYIKAETTKSNQNIGCFNVCHIISDASQTLINQLQDDYSTDDIKFTTFLQWMCALSMSFTNPPINKLKNALITNKQCIYNVLDILFIDILQKGLPFVNKEARTQCVPNNNSNTTDKEWLMELINRVSYDKAHLLTPELVKRLSKTLILMVNLLLFIGAKPIICDYIKSAKSFSTILLSTLLQLLGTYVLPESIHMKTLDLPFHSKTSIVNKRNNTNNNDDDKAPHPTHNDMMQYTEGSRWRLQKSAQITIQFHRLLIKCIWMIINDLIEKEKGYHIILKHPSQRVIILQLMHFSVLSFECALDLLSWICNQTYVYKEKEEREDDILYKLVCNLGVSFVTLCDEYQLEGNEFKVNMFSATLTTEDDDEDRLRQINHSIIPDSKQKSKYLRKYGKKYEAYFSNIIRFANYKETLYTFHVKRAILIVLPLISLCVSVRTEVVQRKEVIEFLKELFYVTLPQCSYLFIRFQYESQYSIEEMISILIKARSGFNKENVFKFYENEAELQSNCITALHIFLYLCDLDGLSCKTMIKNLDRTSKREWRDYVQNMVRFLRRFGSSPLKSIYNEYDFKARLQSLIEYSKPKKVFSPKRHPGLMTNESFNNLYDHDVNIPQFEEYVHRGWMVQRRHKAHHNAEEIKAPPFKKRKLNDNTNSKCYIEESAHEIVDEWPVCNITIKLCKEKTRKRKRQKYILLDDTMNMIYPDIYYSPCLHEIKLLTQWEPAVVKANDKGNKRNKKMMIESESMSESMSDNKNNDDGSLCRTSSSEDEYKPPSDANSKVSNKPTRRRSKRLRKRSAESDDMDIDKGYYKKKKRKHKKKKKKKRKREKKSTEKWKSVSPRDVPALPPLPLIHNNMSAVELISKNAAKDFKLYDELKSRDKLSLKQNIKNSNTNQVIIRQLLTPPTARYKMISGYNHGKNQYTNKQSDKHNNDNNKNENSKGNFMNLPDIHKSFQPCNKSSFNYHNNYNNNINISINNHYPEKKRNTKIKRKKKDDTKRIDLSRSSEEDEVVYNNNNNNNHIIISNLNNNNDNNNNNLNLSTEQTLRLRELLLSGNQQPTFNNDDMFKIDPQLKTQQMANHLYQCFEKQSNLRLSNNNNGNGINKTLFRILLIAENVNDNIIRIECDDLDQDDNEISHLRNSIYSAVKAIALTNTRYIHNNNNKKIVFTAQMIKKRRVDLILDCYHETSTLLIFLRRCDNKANRIFVHSNLIVHNLAKNIIAHLNKHKYIILLPNDIESINIIIESMIVAHSAIKTQFESSTNNEAYWMYCLLEATQQNSLPILGQTNTDPFCSNWLFKIVLNNNY